jgi:hypothetical protein
MKIKIAVLSFIMLAACGGEPTKVVDPTPVDNSTRDKWRAYGAECTASGQTYDACIQMCDDEIASQIDGAGVGLVGSKEAIACHAGARKSNG